MYRPTNADVWTGRTDFLDGEEGYRWHQVIEIVDLTRDELPSLATHQKGIAFLGFCSDEGVKRNLGRVGASQGPKELRKSSASFASHISENLSLVDAGDVICIKNDLEEAHQYLQSNVDLILSENYFPIVLGGGHEVAYGHFMGVASYLMRENPEANVGIINFDAHFDLRHRPEGPSSGTPFLQIAEWSKQNHKDFNYLCLGIQEQSNTKVLFDKAHELDVQYTWASDMKMANIAKLEQKIANFIEPLDAVYITIDLDAFAAAYAPGVSAPAGNGIQPDVVFELLENLIRSGKVISVDIAELNPLFDIDNHTARLGAALIYHLVSLYQKNMEG